jgi:PTS system fructose-specific IIC component
MKFVAITACKEGLVYTYIAKEALEKAFEDTKDEIKIERHTAYGIDNPLTREDIMEADGVFIIADVIFDIKRFRGKKMTFATTKEAISNPKALIDKLKEKITNES